jgi:hypothetical protein
MMRVNPTDNGKRKIEIDTPYLLFSAIVGPGGTVILEASEIREPRKPKQTTDKKPCSTCSRAKRQ